MSLKESYIEYFKNEIDGILNGHGINDISTAVHDEFFYDKNANVDFTLKFLPGQIQNGIPQYPAEIFIQMEEEFKDDIINALNIFIETVNETVVSFDSQLYKQFYTLPSILSAFQNGATKRIVTASISITLFSFNNILGLNKLEIDNENIPFVAVGMGYVAEVNSTGGLQNNETKSSAELLSRSLTVSYVPKITQGSTPTATNKLMDLLFAETPNPNSIFSIKIERVGYQNWTSSWIVKSVSYSQEINGFPLINVTFVRSV